MGQVLNAAFWGWFLVLPLLPLPPDKGHVGASLMQKYIYLLFFIAELALSMAIQNYLTW